MLKHALIACVLSTVIQSFVLVDARQLSLSNKGQSGTNLICKMPAPKKDTEMMPLILPSALIQPLTLSERAIKVNRDFTMISAKNGNPASAKWGIEMSADRDLSLDEAELVYRQLATDVTEYFGSAYVEAARSAAKIFFEKPEELERVTLWFDPVNNAAWAISKKDPTQYLFKIRSPKGVENYLSAFVDGEEKENSYQYSVSLDKQIDSASIVVTAEKLKSWFKLITGREFGIDEGDEVLKQLASDKEVRDFLGINGMSMKAPEIREEIIVGGNLPHRGKTLKDGGNKGSVVQPDQNTALNNLAAGLVKTGTKKN